MKDIPITSQFYSELLKWWSNFREEFDTERDRQNIVRNNKEIRINNKPVFYKNFFEAGITYLRWLNRVMQDHEARASDLDGKLIFSFFLLFS